MPKRKGVSHKQKRSAQIKQQQQQFPPHQVRIGNNDGKKRKTTSAKSDSMANGVVNDGSVSLLPSPPGETGNAVNKYLHKKFKKMATTVETAPQPTISIGAATVESTNGYGNHVHSMSSPAKTGCVTEGGEAPGSESSDGNGGGAAGRYICPYCKILCAKPSVLKKHIRAHTNERPFPCEPCGFSFKTRSNLYKHCRSRTHTLKMEEEVLANQSIPLGGENSDLSSDEANSAGSQVPRLSPVATPSSALPGQSGSGDADADKGRPRNIYKPKFHPAALHYTDDKTAAAEKENCSTALRLRQQQQQQQQQDSPGGGSGPLPHLKTHDGEPTTPLSREGLERHISEIISNNKIIVETNNPIWPSKGAQRSTSKSVDYSDPSSPLSTSSSPGIDTVPWPKKFLYRQMSASQVDNVAEPDKTARESKLALALLKPHKPQDSLPQPVEAPLNLCTNTPKTDSSGTLDLTQPNRRRSSLDKPRPVMQPFQSKPKNSQFPTVGNFCESEGESAFKRVSYGSQDGSVIKDILLKSRAAGNSPNTFVMGAVAQQIATYPGYDRFPDEGPYLDPLYVCAGCKMQYRSPESLKNHVMYQCKGAVAGSDQSPQQSIGYQMILHSPKPSGYSMEPPRTPTKDAIGYPNLVIPPQPSPGPLLGNTPLVESYSSSKRHDDLKSPSPFKSRDPPLKKRRLDSGGQAMESSLHHSPGGLNTTTLRSLEELSKCPMRSNSLQMFGGQVQILDNAGETKTMRIEPSSRGTPTLNLTGLQHPESSVTPDSCGSSVSPPQQMVVTIAKSGLQSGGGTIVVPQKSVPSSESQNHLRTSEIKSKSPYTLSASSGIITLPSSSMLTPTPGFADAARLLMPLMPNITAPNLAIPGIPAPSHLPFITCPPMLQDGMLNPLNPLTNITAFNPLTLAAQGVPPAQAMLQSPLSSPTRASSSSPSTMGLSPHKPIPPRTPISNSYSRSMPLQLTTTTSPALPPYTGGVVTIVHGGKAIPHVPGMPGPQSVIATNPPTTSPGGFKTAAAHSSSTKPYPTIKDRPRVKPTPLINPPIEKKNFTSIPPEVVRTVTENVQISTPTPPVQTISISSAPSPSSSPVAPVALIKPTPVEEPFPLPISLKIKRTRPDSPTSTDGEDISEKKPKISIDTTESQVPLTTTDESEEPPSTSEAKQGNRFLRPTSLPLKPGTFTPKRMLITPNVLPLISPETPRPKKSYGQLYLNGHAYTYLGLKCSTHPFFCTLNRLQPTYVPLSPEHPKLSMYSNWKVYDAETNPFGLDPGQAISLYDSRHRPKRYTVAGAKPGDENMRLTHSSYWLIKDTIKEDKPESEGQEGDQTAGNIDGEEAPKRVKIFAGGFESNEDYTYVRGRGRGRYVCEECGIRCKKPSMLKKHIRTHTDVRPFTCRHCSFSFKTKGNLTKHMKSKAHYKKCMELGIVPVPTVVDESYIDEASLMKQQALRAGRGDAEVSESEDNEDDEDEDEDEDEEEEEEEEGFEDSKGRQEREAAKSLLSLAQTPHPSPGAVASGGGSAPAPERDSRAARLAGLMAPWGARGAGLSTYPYTLTVEHPRRNTSSVPGTPTLATISEHREREKVSHNTGLARDLHEQSAPPEEGKLMAELSSGDGHPRYYFPSSRAATVTVSSAHSPTEKEISESNSEETETRSNELEAPKLNPPLRKTSTGSMSSTSLNYPRTPTTPISDILTPVSDPAFLLASLCSTMEKLPLSLVTLNDASQDSTLLQTYLRERAVQDARVKQSQYHPRKEGTSSTPVTPVGTPLNPPDSLLTYSVKENVLTNSSAVISTISTYTTSSSTKVSAVSSQDSGGSKPPPPLVWALQKPRVSDADLKVHSTISPATPAMNSPIVSNIGPPSLVLLPKTPPPQAPLPVPIQAVKQENLPLLPQNVTMPVAVAAPLPAKISFTPRGGNASEAESSVRDWSDHQGVDVKPNVSVAPNDPASVLSGVAPLCGAGAKSYTELSTIQSAPIAGNATLPQSSTNIPTASSSPPPPISSSLPSKKPKAEFMPPSSGPSPSYVSVAEDGRSTCTKCNKTFSQPSQLRLHLNIHYFERPYRCDVCAVSFRTKGTLQKHDRSVSHHNKVSMNSTFGAATKSNPRPFKCDDCKIAFRIHGHLAKHLRSKMHIMKLECIGKLPFGTYAEIERSGINMNDIDTTDCDNSLESLLNLAQKLCEKDPTKLNQWKQPENAASDAEESSDEGEPIPFQGMPFPEGEAGDDEASSQPNQESSTSPQNQWNAHHPRPHSPNVIKVESSPSKVASCMTAAAAAAAAAIVAAATPPLPQSRAFPPKPLVGSIVGSNGVPSYIQSAVAADAQSSDKQVPVASLGVLASGTMPLRKEITAPEGGVLKENFNNNLGYSSTYTEPWRYNVPGSRLMLLQTNRKESTESKTIVDRLASDNEVYNDRLEVLVEGRTVNTPSMCLVPTKTDDNAMDGGELRLGGLPPPNGQSPPNPPNVSPSLQPSANR